MFAMFAMTTDSVGIIIPEIIKTFGLSMTAAGTFQYATMAGIALAGFFLGSLADRLGRKPTIVIGLTAFGIASFLFADRTGRHPRGRRSGRSGRRRTPSPTASMRPPAGPKH